MSQVNKWLVTSLESSPKHVATLLLDSAPNTQALYYATPKRAHQQSPNQHHLCLETSYLWVWSRWDQLCNQTLLISAHSSFPPSHVLCVTLQTHGFQRNQTSGGWATEYLPSLLGFHFFLDLDPSVGCRTPTHLIVHRTQSLLVDASKQSFLEVDFYRPTLCLERPRIKRNNICFSSSYFQQNQAGWCICNSPRVDSLVQFRHFLSRKSSQDIPLPTCLCFTLSTAVEDVYTGTGEKISCINKTGPALQYF